jgi:hypothetical protein
MVVSKGGERVSVGVSVGGSVSVGKGVGEGVSVAVEVTVKVGVVVAVGVSEMVGAAVVTRIEKVSVGEGVQVLELVAAGFKNSVSSLSAVRVLY